MSNYFNLKVTESLKNEQSSFSKLCHFTYVTAHSHSPSFPSLHLRHSSFSNPSLALLKSQLILQPSRCFTYVTAHSRTLLSLLLRHRIFTYVTCRAAHGEELAVFQCCHSSEVLNLNNSLNIKIKRKF